MSTTFCPEQEAAINAEQNRIIAANCAKHGIQANQLTEGQIADARRTAEQNVEREQALASDPHYARAEQLQEENRQLKMQLAAMKDSRPRQPQTAQYRMRTLLTNGQLPELAGRTGAPCPQTSA